MRVTQNALEEYFRLRLGQAIDFANDMAEICDGREAFEKSNPNHERNFARMISRRDHIQDIMKAVFSIAFEPYGYLQKKTDDMMIAECIWDAIRVARGVSKYGHAFAIGSEPVPKITEVKNGEKKAQNSIPEST